MKTVLYVVGLGCAFGAGWFLRPVSEVSEGVTKQEGYQEYRVDKEVGSSIGDTDEKSVPVRTKTVIVESTQEDQEKEQKKLMKNYTAGLAESFEKKLRFQIDTFLVKLDLDEGQLSRIENFIKEEVETYKNLTQQWIGGEAAEGDITNKSEKLAEVASLAGIEQVFNDVLTTDQLEEYKELHLKDKGKKIESKALKELANIQGELDLSDEQKDAIYGVLYEEAELDANSKPSASMAALGGEEALDAMGLGGYMKFMEKANESGEDVDMKVLLGRYLDEKAQRLGGVLTEDQLERYRSNLEQKVSPFMNMLPSEE